MISRIEKGLINDDFLHARITLNVFTGDPRVYIPCKLYDDGRLVSFTGYGEDYVEEKITGELAKDIKAAMTFDDKSIQFDPKYLVEAAWVFIVNNKVERIFTSEAEALEYHEKHPEMTMMLGPLYTLAKK